MGQMQLGFCWAFQNVSPRDGLARLAGCGFDGVELWPDALKASPIDTWAQALHATGMRCLQLCPYFDFVHGQDGIDRSRTQLREFLDAAGRLGCQRLRVFTGPPWGEGVVGAAAATEAQWQASIEGLKHFCDRAAAHDVELCLECHEGGLAEDSVSALRLLHGVDRPNLTVNLQLPLLREHWQTSLRELGRFTTHVHIHNWTRSIGEGDLTFLADGAFDWSPVLHHLVNELNRDLCVSVEHSDHGGRHDPWETATRDGAYLNALRSRINATHAPL